MKPRVGPTSIGEECVAEEASPFGWCDCVGKLQDVRRRSRADGICLKAAAPGAPCVAPYDCGDLACDMKSGTCLSGIGVDAPCSFRNAANPLPGTELVPCSPGLACDIATLRCTTLLCATGCTTDADCGGRPCVSGACAPLIAPPPPEGGLAIGAACTATDVCATGACQLGDGGAGECIELKPRGALCSSGAECAGSCEMKFGGTRCTLGPDGHACAGR